MRFRCIKATNLDRFLSLRQRKQFIHALVFQIVGNKLPTLQVNNTKIKFIPMFVFALTVFRLLVYRHDF